MFKYKIKNMKLIFLNLFLACFVLTQISCKCQGDYDCTPYSILKLRILKDGQNAVFSSHPFIDRNSITFMVQRQFGVQGEVNFDENTGTIHLYVFIRETYVLNIQNIRIDTISATFKLIEKGECCDSYQFANVTMNSQIICQDGCDDIIEVQL